MTDYSPPYYILNDAGEPERCSDPMAWARWMEHADRTVKKTVIMVGVESTDEILISTVFLGTDHNFGVLDEPVLFETMVFGGPLDQQQHRYITREQALATHDIIVREVHRAIAAAALHQDHRNGTHIQ